MTQRTQLPSTRIEHGILAACDTFYDSVAVMDDETSVSFAELSRSSGEVARTLAGSGHMPGEPVLVAAENRCSDVIAQLAVWRGGGVAVPVHRSTPLPVLKEIARRTGARTLVAPRSSVPAAWGPEVDEDSEWVSALHTESQHPHEVNEEQALVAFTSGSTGRSKGVVLSHAAFGAKLDAIAEVLPFEAGTVTLQVLHLNFTFGQWTTLLSLLSGATVKLVRKFGAENVLRRLRSDAVDRIAVVPTMLRLMLAALDAGSPGLTAESFVDCPSPGLWIAGGEPLAAGLGRRVLDTFPRTQLADVFGLSETSTSDLILTPDKYLEDAGTVGHPSPGVEVRIVEEEAGRDQRTGDTGELWIKTPFLMTGYLDDPVETSRAMAGEWFRTGDLARLTPTGAVELVGRSKFLILRGGHKISPLTVENVVTEHPACRGACALGIADPVLGERLVVLFMPGHETGVSAQSVRGWIKGRLQPYEVPDEIVMVDDLPLGRTGKLDRLTALAGYEGMNVGSTR